jgi:hypothetical protein
MAIDLDNFPTYDPLIKEGSVYMSNVWSDFLATFMETLQGYLSQYGIDMPPVTTEIRDSLQNVPNGRIIYNSSTNKLQGYEAGVWVNLV